MADIGYAVQNGSKVTAYDMNNKVLFSVQGQLMGYTAASLSVKNNNKITVYDSKGYVKFSVASN